MKTITRFTSKPCQFCAGKGCTQCNKGIKIEKSYIVVAKDEKGQKIAFQADFGGK